MGQIYMEGYSFKMWGRLGKFNVDKFAKLESFIRNSWEIKAISIGLATVSSYFFQQKKSHPGETDPYVNYKK